MVAMFNEGSSSGVYLPLEQKQREAAVSEQMRCVGVAEATAS